MTELSYSKKKVEIVLLRENLNGVPLVAVFKRSAANGDVWFAFPGGKYAEKDNPDETLVEGALRECNEELSVKPDLLAVFSQSLQHPKTPTTLTTFILAKCDKGQEPANVDPKENGELMWLVPYAASRLVSDRAPQEVHDYLKRIACPK